MKVTMVSKIDEGSGGIASYTKSLNENLTSNGIEVENRDLLDSINAKGDVIHIQHEPFLYGKLSYFFPITLLMIKLITKKPVVLTLHGLFKKEEIAIFAKENGILLPPVLLNIGINFIFKYSVTFSDAVIVHAECFKKWLIQYYHCDPDKIYVIPHGIWEVTPIDKKIAKQKLGFSNKVVIFTLGYLAKHKGLDDLINIFNSIGDENIILVIGGGMSKRLQTNQSFLHYLTKIKADLPDNIIFPGYISYEDLHTFFSAADIFILSHQRRVSASGPLCRAIGYGLPVLALDNEIFRDYLPNYCLTNDLFDSIKQFLKSPELAKSACEWSNSFKVKYSWDNIGKMTISVYQSVLSN